MAKTLKAVDFANWIINHADREAGEAITHLKAQKLLYFAQAYYLANFNKALFEEDFEAWAHCPVVTDVWHKFKQYAWEALPIREKAPVFSDKQINKYMLTLYDKYGKLGAKRLEEITHQHAPWKDARGDLPPESKCSTVIDKKKIRDFYAERIGQVWKKPFSYA